MVAAVGVSIAAVSSVNFNRNNDEDFGTALSAGAVEVSNWNQSVPDNAGAVGGTFTNAIDDTGVATTADITFSAANTWASGGANTADGNTSLLKGYLDDSNGGALAVIDVTEIPYALYDVYVYGMGDSAQGALLNAYSFDDGSGAQSFSFLRAANYTAGTALVEGDATTEGHYFKISGVSASSFSLSNDNNRGDGRSPIAGFQIVAVPEPSSSSLGILALGSLALIRRRTGA